MDKDGAPDRRPGLNHHPHSVKSSGGLAASEELELQEKISRVENGLLFTQTITERMTTHHVPGIGLAVINDFELEWVKGYGVVKLGSTESNRVAPYNIVEDPGWESNEIPARERG